MKLKKTIALLLSIVMLMGCMAVPCYAKSKNQKDGKTIYNQVKGSTSSNFATAMVAVAYRVSGVNCKYDGKQGIGCMLWYGGNAKALKNYAKKHGYKWTSPKCQGKFIAYELKHGQWVNPFNGDNTSLEEAKKQSKFKAYKSIWNHYIRASYKVPDKRIKDDIKWAEKAIK